MVPRALEAARGGRAGHCTAHHPKAERPDGNLPIALSLSSVTRHMLVHTNVDPVMIIVIITVFPMMVVVVAVILVRIYVSHNLC